MRMDKKRDSHAKIILCEFEKFQAYVNANGSEKLGRRLENVVRKAIDAGEVDPKDLESLASFVTDTHNGMVGEKWHVSMETVRRQLAADALLRMLRGK